MATKDKLLTMLNICDYNDKDKERIRAILFTVAEEQLAAALRGADDQQLKSYLAELLGQPPGVPVHLSDDAIVVALHHQFGQQFDGTAGNRLMNELSQRANDAPIWDKSGALSVGQQFPLLGFGPLIRDLACKLREMEVNLEFARKQRHENIYRRGYHGFQLVGTPGIGKTTAATAMWAGLHYACTVNAQGLLPVDKEHWDSMRERIVSSLSPSKLLVFRLDMSLGGLTELHPLEQCHNFNNILALRLLYATMRQHYYYYNDFLSALSLPLLQSLRPQHVADFVRQQAGFAPADKLLMTWIFDEAQAMTVQLGPQGSPRPIAQLLAAFVDFRVQCAMSNPETQPSISATLPIVVTASTLWSTVRLASSHKLTMAELRLLPLNIRQCKHILSRVVRRIRQQQQQQQQQVEEPRQPPAQPEQPEQWPTFSLQSSSTLEDGPLAPVTATVLQLTSGIPRLLSYGIAAMGGVGPGYIFKHSKLLEWLDKPPEDLHAAERLLMTGSHRDPRWQTLSHRDNKLLLDIVFCCDILQEPVRREGLVAPPELIDRIKSCSKSNSSCSSSYYWSSMQLSKMTWEGVEQEGLLLLMTPDGRQQLLSEGASNSIQQGATEKQEYFVRGLPLLMVAAHKHTYPWFTVAPLAALLSGLQSNIPWQEREHLDVVVVAVRCLVAAKVFGHMSMTLRRLLKCRELPQDESSGVLGTEPWLPRHEFHVRVVKEQLTQQEFQDLVAAFMQDPEDQPSAYLGPGWLMLHQVVHSVTSPAPRESFIVFIHGKQLMNVQSVEGASIDRESIEDVICKMYKHAYVYVTDQKVLNAPTGHVTVTLTPQEHELFYSCCSALLQLADM